MLEAKELLGLLISELQGVTLGPGLLGSCRPAGWLC